MYALSAQSTLRLAPVACLLWTAVFVMTDRAIADTNDDLLAHFQAGVFKSSDGLTLPYRLMGPKNLEPGKKYPLVLFLHGAGERGDDNKVQLVHAAADFASNDRRDKFPAFVLFPQCPAGHRWVESPWDLPSGRDAFPEQPSLPMKMTLELVDQLAWLFSQHKK